MQPWIQEVTDAVMAGSPNDVDYRGWYGPNDAGTSGSANISMGSYIVSYE